MLAISSLAGAHMTIARETIALLKSRGAGDVQLVMGGIIPEADRAAPARSRRQSGLHAQGLEPRRDRRPHHRNRKREEIMSSRRIARYLFDRRGDGDAASRVPALAEEARPWLCRDKPVFSYDRSMEYVATARPGREWRMFFMQYSPDAAHDGFDIVNSRAISSRRSDYRGISQPAAISPSRFTAKAAIGSAPTTRMTTAIRDSAK